MQVKVQAYQPLEGNPLPRMPAELENLREWAVMQVTSRMRVFGIAKIGGKPVTVGLRTVYEVTYKAMNLVIPEALRVFRNATVREEAEFMIIFGITEIEIELTEEELRTLKSSWDDLQIPRKITPAAVESDANPKQTTLTELPLNVELDPTGKG